MDKYEFRRRQHEHEVAEAVDKGLCWLCGRKAAECCATEAELQKYRESGICGECQKSCNAKTTDIGPYRFTKAV